MAEYLIRFQGVSVDFLPDGLHSFACILVVGFYRRIFVYTFCLINICLSLSDDANKIKTLNIERE